MLGGGLKDAHTFSLEWQGNVYSTASITQHGSSTTNLIVATLNRKVFRLELSMSHCARSGGWLVVPLSQELQLTYIPSGAEIISTDAFNRSEARDDFVIGVTIIKRVESGSPGQYLNIYSELDDLAQSCLSLELEFVPYQLSHCQLPGGEVVWLLGGSDRRVHVYREDKTRHMYAEVEAGSTLPEFRPCFPSVPLWTDTKVERGIRVAATGCEWGLLKVTVVNLSTNQITNTWTKEFDGPLTCTKLFHLAPSLEKGPPSCLKPALDDDLSSSDSRPQPLNLCVTYSLGSSQVFHDILSNGLADWVKLPESSGFDSATTICVADLSMTGRQQLVLGTYGQELLCYSCDEGGSWHLSWQRSFPAPVLGIMSVDMTGDGLDELVVATTRGVHVLQRDLAVVQDILLDRLRMLVEMKDKKSPGERTLGVSETVVAEHYDQYREVETSETCKNSAKCDELTSETCKNSAKFDDLSQNGCVKADEGDQCIFPS